MAIRWGSYKVKNLHDELLRASGRPRPAAQAMCSYLRGLKDRDIEEYKAAAESAIHVMGITFTVYGDPQQTEKIFPFDLMPRIIPDTEWRMIEEIFRQSLFECVHARLDRGAQLVH